MLRMLGAPARRVAALIALEALLAFKRAGADGVGEPPLMLALSVREALRDD